MAQASKRGIAWPLFFKDKSVYGQMCIRDRFIWLVVLFFSCFLIYTYWETVVSICNKIFVASQPFLFGAGIAFVVNILMSFYEKILIKFIPFGFITKIKRPVSLLLAFATIGLIFTWVVFTVLPDLIDLSLIHIYKALSFNDFGFIIK